MKDKRGDVTVSEAANSLGVTTRSVLNYIKAKEIDALKVGSLGTLKRPLLILFQKDLVFIRPNPQGQQN